MTSNRFSGDIKLVSIDVDNTLVDSRKLIPKENIEAIKWAHQEKGIHFAINSGRIAASTRHFMEQIGVHECFPSLNGVLLHSWDGRILEEHSVDRDASLKICAMARSLGVGLFAYRHEGWHLDNGQDYWAESEFKASGIEGEMTDIELFLRSNNANKLLGAHLDENVISSVVTVFVVDHFEVVYVDHRDKEGLGILHGSLEFGHHEMTVIKTCQAVGVGSLTELILVIADKA